MPLWVSWHRDLDILNIFYDELKSEKMTNFETLIVPRGLTEFFAKGSRLHFKNILKAISSTMSCNSVNKHVQLYSNVCFGYRFQIPRGP